MMIKSIRSFVFLQSLILSLFVGSGFAAVSAETTVEQFNAAFVEANDLRKEAGELGHEWRDTAKILKQAQELAQEGKLTEAMELVATAKMQGEEAIYQANREASLWVGRVIR